MSDLELAYRQKLQKQQDQYIEDFMNDPVPYSIGGEPQGPPSPASPAESTSKKPSVMGAAVKATKETAVAGYQHFVNGARDTFNAKGYGDIVSANGEKLLGGLTVLMALPTGVGAAIKQAMTNYTPGLEKSIAISGDAAGVARTMLGLPSFLLDPKMRKLAFSDPSKFTPEEQQQVQQLADELKKPMTYGELMDTAMQFVTPGILMKGARLARGKLAGEAPKMEPLQVQDAAGVTQPKTWQEPWSPPEYPDKPTMSLEDMAARLGTVAEDIHGAGAEKSTPKGSTAPKEPVKGAEAATPSATDSYPTQLKSALEVGVQKAEEMVKEELDKTPESGLTYDEFNAARKIREAVREKSVDLGDMTTRQPRSKGARPKLGSMEPLAGPEAGGVDTGLIARMAIGAAIGGTQGDTAEERVGWILAGALGGASAKRFATMFVNKLKTDPATAPILDNANPKMPGMSVPPADARLPIERVMDTVGEQHREVLDRVLAGGADTPLSFEDKRLGKQLETRAWAHVSELSKKIIAGEDVQKGDLTNAMALGKAIHMQLDGKWIGASTGQGTARVKTNVGAIDKLAREFNPSMSERDLAYAVQASGAIQDVGVLSRLYYAIPESILQAEYGAMLSGKALVKNAVGNAPMVPISIMSRSFAQLRMMSPHRALNDGVQGTIAMAEGIMDQLRMIHKWDALGEQAKAMGSSHVEVAARGFEGLADITRQTEFAGESGSEMLAKGMEMSGSLVNLGPGIMSRTDGMFKAINGRLQLQWEAMDAARAEGLAEGSDAFWNRTADLVKNYDQLDPQALVRIKEFRDHQTFTRPFEGHILQALQAGPSDPWLNLAYRTFLFPFVRTPVRLAEIGAEFTPGLNVAAKHFWTEWNKGGIARATTEANLALGGAVMGGFTWLSMQGLVTGNLPNDNFKQQQAMEQAGRPAQSFWDPLVEKYRSYAGMEPLTTLVSIGADFGFLLGQLPEKDASNLVTAYALAVSKNIPLTQFMQSVSALMDIMKAGSTDAQWDLATKYIRQKLTVFVPAGLQEAARAVGTGETTKLMKSGAYDEEKGILPIVYRELQALVDDYKRKLGVPQIRAMLGMTPPEEGSPPFIKQQRNMWTGEHLVNDTWPWNPFTTKPAIVAPWASEIQKFAGAGITPLTEWMGQHQVPDLGLGQTPTNPGVRLLPAELDRWEVLMTQVVKDPSGHHLTESLDQLVQSELYKRQNDNTKKDMLHSTWTAFKREAQDKLLQERPQLREALTQKIGASQIDRHVPTAEQPAARERLQQRLRTTP